MQIRLLLYTLILSIIFYFVGFLHNVRYRFHPFHDYDIVMIRRLKKLFLFTKKDKGVIRYCYVIQAAAILLLLINLSLLLLMSLLEDGYLSYAFSNYYKYYLGFLCGALGIYIMIEAFIEYRKRKKKETNNK